MNPSQEYVARLLSELQRLRRQEAEVLEKLINHFESTDHGLHERYMRLDTGLAKVQERVRNLEDAEKERAIDKIAQLSQDAGMYE